MFRGRTVPLSEPRNGIALVLSLLGRGKSFEKAVLQVRLLDGSNFVSRPRRQQIAADMIKRRAARPPASTFTQRKDDPGPHLLRKTRHL